MTNKKCFKCNKVKSLSEYYTHPRMSDGHLNKCKECTRKDVKGRSVTESEKVKAYDKLRYRTNIKRIKAHKYRGIKNRCTGKHKNRTYKVEGMPYLTQSEYDKWWEDNIADFNLCYQVWEKSGFKNKYAPSIDRIDSTKGYTTENMQWLTFYVNCSKHNK